MDSCFGPLHSVQSHSFSLVSDLVSLYTTRRDRNCVLRSYAEIVTADRIETEGWGELECEGTDERY